MLKKKWTFVLPFIAISTILYVIILFFNEGLPINVIDYLGICLCLVMSFLLGYNSLDLWLVRAGLLLTAISDYFLVLIGGHELVALITFSIVQLIYATRLWTRDPNRKTRQMALSLRGTMIIIALTSGIIVLKDRIDPLALFALFYFSNLVMNVIISGLHYQDNRLFAIGLILFLGCDIMVGLGNLNGYLSIVPGSIWWKLIHAQVDLVWLFYLPSQVLITLSILTGNHKTTKSS